MDRQDLADRYREKLEAARPELIRLRKERAKREANEWALRAELENLQKELNPLFEFIRLIAEWVGPDNHPVFVVSLHSTELVLRLDIPPGSPVTIEILGTAPPMSNKESRESYIQKRNRLVSGYDFGTARTVAAVYEDAESLKALRQLNFVEFMETLMDYTISNGLNFLEVFRTDYVRLNCS